MNSEKLTVANGKQVEVGGAGYAVIALDQFTYELREYVVKESLDDDYPDRILATRKGRIGFRYYEPNEIFATPDEAIEAKVSQLSAGIATVRALTAVQ